MSTTPPGYREPFESVTSNDQTAWIVIAATLGTVYSLMFLGFRTFIRRTSGLGRLSSDDIALGAATLVAVVQSGVVLGACSSGLGKHWLSLDAEMQREVQQMTYASTLLFVIALGFVFLFLFNLMADPTQKKMLRIALASVVVWTVASFLALALQCDITHAWKTSGEKCEGSALRWQIISAFDILLEVLVICFAGYLVWDVQITSSKKWTVLSAFAVRLLTIITTIFRLTTFNQSALSTNPTFEAQFQVWIQAGMHVSTISATVLILRPVIYNLSTNYGSLGPTISHAYGAASQATYVMSNLSGVQRSRQADTKFGQSLAESRGTEYIASASVGHARNGAHRANVETESVESGSSQRMIIKKKTSWKIETYDKDAESGPRE
ncbi:hypothetical protein B0A48_18559 [Cryoendolithus antarcticus]|uniref:Rhodopsin domain-containing protein n=1 Tax=Cryoendolithus antarcticus TaxID=1507870 RepID=A0A1V8S8I5_9PEZI|nr:hypothetical protein B0A48_18559 [Cryoendolithus antarcticus]